MADVRISELPSATSPTGTETVPTVQSGATKKVAVREIAKVGYQSVVTESSATKTLAEADRGAWIRFTNASACALTVPANATTAFAIGEVFNGIQAAAGKVTISGAAGVTINVPAEFRNNTRAQGAPICLIKVATDTWDLIGDLEAL